MQTTSAVRLPNDLVTFISYVKTHYKNEKHDSKKRIGHIIRPIDQKNDQVLGLHLLAYDDSLFFSKYDIDIYIHQNLMRKLYLFFVNIIIIEAIEIDSSFGDLLKTYMDTVSFELESKNIPSDVESLILSYTNICVDIVIDIVNIGKFEIPINLTKNKNFNLSEKLFLPIKQGSEIRMSLKIPQMSKLSPPTIVNAKLHCLYIYAPSKFEKIFYPKDIKQFYATYNNSTN